MLSLEDFFPEKTGPTESTPSWPGKRGEVSKQRNTWKYNGFVELSGGLY